MHCVFHIRQIFKERGAVAPVRSELRPEGAVPMARAGPKTAGRKAGGANRDRTDDLLLAKQALSQLSYGPEPYVVRQILVGLAGVAPATSPLSGVRSN